MPCTSVAVAVRRSPTPIASLSARCAAFVCSSLPVRHTPLLTLGSLLGEGVRDAFALVAESFEGCPVTDADQTCAAGGNPFGSHLPVCPPSWTSTSPGWDERSGVRRRVFPGPSWSRRESRPHGGRRSAVRDRHRLAWHRDVDRLMCPPHVAQLGGRCTGPRVAQNPWYLMRARGRGTRWVLSSEIMCGPLQDWVGVSISAGCWVSEPVAEVRAGAG